MRIIIDANVLKDIARGNIAASQALRRLLTSGHEVYIARAAYNEVVSTPGLGDAYRSLIEELHIRLPPATSREVRVDFYHENIQYYPVDPNNPVRPRITEYGGVRVDGIKIRPGDAFVAAEAKSFNAKLWTLDGKFARRARELGVDLWHEPGVTGISGVEDIGRARRLLGLRVNVRES
jgi:predicted nucleic acid-binding protein